MPSSRLAWIGLAIRLGTAGIWLVAGITKLFELETFKTGVAAYDVLPHSLVAPFAYALPFVEAGTGLYLLIGLFVRPAAILTSVMIVAFVAAQAQAWARGLRLDCGCFGSLAASRVGFWTILRDTALGIPGLVMAIKPARALSVDMKVLGLADGFGPGWHAKPARYR